MKNQFLLMTFFCLISNVACPMASSIKLDKNSEINLLQYALAQALKTVIGLKRQGQHWNFFFV